MLSLGNSLKKIQILSVSGLVTALLFCPILIKAQGFGGIVKKAKFANLKRTLPASVNLNNKRIKVVSLGATARIPRDLLPVLQTKWITAIQSDPRFILDEKNPETELRFTITSFSVQKWNVPASQGSPACGYYTGRIEVSYQAIEVQSDIPLDSENLAYIINKEAVQKSSGILNLSGFPRSSQAGCGTKAMATEQEVHDNLVNGIVAEMSRRAAPFEETLSVPIPGGKLDTLSALALSQRWAKLLEEAEKTDPLPQADEDAYRIYLIGFANEGLAYQEAKDAADLEKARRGDIISEAAKQSIEQESKHFVGAQAYLDKAAKAYKDALQAKPSEKVFSASDGRMEQAVRLYATIARHKSEYEAAIQKKKNEIAMVRANGTPKAAPKTPGLPLDRIIRMCQDHVTDIAQLIKDHPIEIHFENGLTLDEELHLRKECGGESKGIIAAIKAQSPNKLPLGKR
jgi:hypothetical protein